MSGNSADRRKARRAKEREARKKMEEAWYPWNEVSIVKSEPHDEATSPTLDELIKYGNKLPATPIVQPEPSGEAEIDFWKELENFPMDESFYVIEETPKKKRGIWNWLRKLVGR